MKISKKTLAATTTALISLIVALITYAGLLYLIERTEMQLIEMGKETKRMNDEALQYAALEKLVTDTELDRAELQTYLLSDAGVIDFLTLLEKTAANAGTEVLIRDIATAPLEGTEYEMVTVNIELDGTYRNVSAVIDLFEHLPYQSRIEEVSLDRTSTDGDLWHATIALSVTKLKT